MSFGRILVFVLLLTSSRGFAEPPLLEDGRLATAREDLRRALAAARQESLPEEWLERKVREGLAKQVPPPRIAEAVAVLLSRMRAADRIASAGAIPRGARDARRLEVLRKTTDALASGAPPDRLERLAQRIARDRPNDRATHLRDAMAAVAELGERGFDGHTAVKAAERAYEKAGVAGVRAVVEAARTFPPAAGEEQRRRLLERAATADRILRERRPPGLERPSDRGGPPRDDAMGQGKGRGKARP